jgi:hypothetical protein
MTKVQDDLILEENGNNNKTKDCFYLILRRKKCTNLLLRVDNIMLTGVKEKALLFFLTLPFFQRLTILQNEKHRD